MKRPALSSLLLASCLLLGACAAVLGIKPARTERAFPHRAHSLKGIACTDCHKDIARAGDEGPLHLPSEQKCLDCHKTPHTTESCARCHGDAQLRKGAEMARTHLRFSHAEHVSTLGGQCVPCHAAAGEQGAQSLRPPMAQCFSCHNHKDQWTSATCDGCHVDLPREASKPQSHVMHDGDFLREHGVRAAASRDLCASCHSEASCAACHGVSTPQLPWRMDFTRPKLGALHPAGFRSRHADEARAMPGTCTTCHSAESFCSDCHSKERVGGQGALGGSPHPPGWVRARGGDHGRAARMDPLSCASCHGGQGEMLCVGCHRVGGPGGNPHGPGFASAKDPGRDEPCRKCHGA